MAIIDVIKFDGRSDGSQWLIHKCPSDQFVLGSQLIVNQGQEALFFKGGKPLDLFGPGTFTLKTGNLPILKSVINLPFGGRTPFAAEVYFVNTTVNLDMKWGTSTPVPIEDPRYGMILNIGARGQYGIKISDSRLFVSKIIGAVPEGFITNPQLILKYFNGLINSKVKSVTAGFMIQNQVSFLEISQYLSELSESLKEVLIEEFDRFGIEIVNFYCISIAPKPEEYKKLQKYKEELALGSDFYQKRRSLDILEKLVDNPAASELANAGIGLGLGLGSAGQFGNAFTDISQKLEIPSAENMIKCPNCNTVNPSTMKYCGNCGSELMVHSLCPHCGSKIENGMKFCGECGKPVMPLVSKCPNCGFENKSGMKFCGNCGTKL